LDEAADYRETQNQERKRKQEESKRKRQEEAKKEGKEQLEKESKAHMTVEAALGGVSIKLTEETAKIIFNGLSKRRHPDVGGSNEQMLELTEAYNTILAYSIYKN